MKIIFKDESGNSAVEEISRAYEYNGRLNPPCNLIVQTLDGRFYGFNAMRVTMDAVPTGLSREDVCRGILSDLYRENCADLRAYLFYDIKDRDL